MRLSQVVPVVGRLERASDPADRDSDAAVVRRVRAGDTDAYAILVNRYHARCLRFALRTLGERADAEDAVQVTFVRAWGALDRYREESRFLSWLFAILVNECRTIAGRARRQSRLVELDAAIEDRAGGADQRYDDGERLSWALARLEPTLREAFMLRHVEGLSYEEMQDSTGAGASALRMRVKRACDALRALLEDR